MGKRSKFPTEFYVLFFIFTYADPLLPLRYAEILNETSKVIKSREFIVETTVSVCIIATYLHSLICVPLEFLNNPSYRVGRNRCTLYEIVKIIICLIEIYEFL